MVLLNDPTYIEAARMLAQNVLRDYSREEDRIRAAFRCATGRQPAADERKILQAIHEKLAAYEGENEDELQSIPFDVARDFEVSPRDLFTMFYEVVLGQERGPRFGTFTRLVGKERVISLLKETQL